VQSLKFSGEPSQVQPSGPDLQVVSRYPDFVDLHKAVDRPIAGTANLGWTSLRVIAQGTSRIETAQHQGLTLILIAEMLIKVAPRGSGNTGCEEANE
jgi:hypothetical protein